MCPPPPLEFCVTILTSKLPPLRVGLCPLLQYKSLVYVLYLLLVLCPSTNALYLLSLPLLSSTGHYLHSLQMMFSPKAAGHYEITLLLYPCLVTDPAGDGGSGALTVVIKALAEEPRVQVCVCVCVRVCVCVCVYLCLSGCRSACVCACVCLSVCLFICASSITTHCARCL